MHADPTRVSFAFEPHGGSVRALRHHLRVVLAPVEAQAGCEAMALICELAVAAVDARSRFEVAVALEEAVLRFELTANVLPDPALPALLERVAERFGVTTTADGRAFVWFELDAETGRSVIDLELESLVA